MSDHSLSVPPSTENGRPTPTSIHPMGSFGAVSTPVKAAAALLLVAVLGWLLLGEGLGLLDRLSGRAPAGQPPAVSGRPPDFSLSSADGQTVSLQAFQGQPAIVNFWATWCVPCRTEMPAFEAAYQAHQAGGLAVLAVNLGESREEIVPFGRDLGLSFPLLLDPLGRTAAEYGVKGLPTTFFIDRRGRITHIHHGALTETTLNQQIARIMQ